MSIPSIPEGDPPVDDDSLLQSLPYLLQHIVGWLHHWGKDGTVPLHVVDHRLNMYLAMPWLMREGRFFQRRAHLSIMCVEDSPCFENLPDLWCIMRDTLKCISLPRKKHHSKNMLHLLFTQALPCFHQTCKNVLVDELMPVALNILLALLLGLYKNSNKKPHFAIRVCFFEKIRSLITSNTTVQQEFFDTHHNLFVLAFMEYIAQVAPLYWPIEHQFLLDNNNMQGFFERMPLVCDEFRIFSSTVNWKDLEQHANLKIHKCIRSRRLNKSDVMTTTKKRLPCDVSVFLDCPTINPRHLHGVDTQLLAHAFQIPHRIIQEGHSMIRVFPLPCNVKDIQIQSLQKRYSCSKLRYISSRLYVCVNCAYHKNSLHQKFRLHMQSEKIVCSECLQDNVISIDALGRTVIVHGMTFVLCPTCCKVHQYKSYSENWMKCTLSDTPEDTPNHTCWVCHESTPQCSVYERVNHLVGEMETIAFCHKHQPSEQAMRLCVNMAQMKQLLPRKGSWLRKANKPNLYDY